MQILIDNGHGHNTPGKQSPDGTLREYRATRQIALALREMLTFDGIPATLLCPEDNDTPLGERVRRANRLSVAHSSYSSDTLLISIHLNAAGDGTKWRTARGCSAYAAPRSSERSKQFARLYTAKAIEANLTGNRSIPKEGYWTGDFAIIRDTICPAVLTENLFMDNSEDCALLKTPQGREQIARLHLSAIRQYIALQKQ